MMGEIEAARTRSMDEGIPPAQVVPRDTAGATRPPAWPPSSHDPRRRGRAIAVVATLVAVSIGIALSHLQRGARKHRYVDQGMLLVDTHPMQALAYILAARSEGVEGPGLHRLFSTAARSAPLVTIVVPAEDGLLFLHAAFNHDGSRVITANSDATAQLWDAATATPVAGRLHPGDGKAQPREIPTEIWNVRTGMASTYEPALGSGVCTTAYGQDGRLVVLEGAYAGVRGWDPARGQPVAAPLVLQGRVFEGCAVARGPGGVRYLAINEQDHAVIVWDAATGTPATPPLPHPAEITYAAFSADASRVLTTSAGMVRSWDATTGRPLGPPVGPTSMYPAVFSPDGTQIAVSGVAQVFDVASGTRVTAPPSDVEIRIVAFSPDGTRILAAGETTARVWDIASGLPLTEPLDHADHVSTAMFSPDGKRVLTAVRSGKVVHIWRIAADDPRDPSPTRVTRSGDACAGTPLTPSDMGTLDEWRRFARCTPFSLHNGVPVPNPAPARQCYPTDCRVAPFLDFR